MNIRTIQFLFFLMCSFLSKVSFCQQDQFYPDSVVAYSLMSLDTAHKIPMTKIVNQYTEDFKLQERWIYRWDRMTKRWMVSKHLALHYYPKEILVEVFQFNAVGEKQHHGRLIISLDSKGKKMIQADYLVKDKHKETFNRLDQYKYDFKKDTITRISKYHQGSTFFLQQETTFTRSRSSQWVETCLSFNELDKKVKDSVKTKYSFISNQLVSSLYTILAFQPNSFKDTFMYKKDKLERTHHKQPIVGYTSPELMKVNYTIKYEYTIKGHLTASILMIEDEKGIPKQHVKNVVTLFYCKQNSPIRKKKLFQYNLEDQLLIFNELN